MFRDLKEYQNLQKLYEEKVSKVENINEQSVRGANMKGSVNVGNMFKKIGDALKPKPIVRPQGSTSVRQSSVNTTKTEVKKEPEYKPVPGVVFGQRTNETGALGKGKPSSVFHDTSKGPDVIEPESQKNEFGPGGQPSASEQIKRSRLAGKTGKERAQELAKMRIGSGTAKNPDTKIKDLKKANTKSMKERAKARFEKFKADREAKRLERMKEEYTPYDMVLEYLLSTEQAATIEEANYVMTEMDADTIQGIVEEQEKNLDEKFNLGKITLGQIGSTALKAGLGVGAYKLAFGGGKGDTPSKPSSGNTPNISDDKNKKKNKGEDLLKQGIEVIKKAKENPGTGLNPNTREALKIMNNNGY